jgi:hypothetical protein
VQSNDALLLYPKTRSEPENPILYAAPLASTANKLDYTGPNIARVGTSESALELSILDPPMPDLSRQSQQRRPKLQGNTISHDAGRKCMIGPSVLDIRPGGMRLGSLNRTYRSHNA